MNVSLVLQRSSLVLCGAGLLAGLTAIRPQSTWPNAPYDDAEALARLQRVSRSLQLYRAEYGHKPVEDWRTPWDAGLPPSPVTLVTPGHAWTLPNGWRDLQPRDMGMEHFCNMIGLWPDPEDLAKMKRHANWQDWETQLARFGTRLPIVADEQFGTQPNRSQPPMRDIRFVRWDGTIGTATVGEGEGGTIILRQLEP
jgi:hypothetical protein